MKTLSPFLIALLILIIPTAGLPNQNTAITTALPTDPVATPQVIHLSPEQIKLANIQVSPLIARQIDYTIYAPGEVLANGYRSFLVSARVDSVVLRRHVSLGDFVAKGQPLVTLFSDVVAQAQAAYRIALAEYERVKKLGKKSVGEKRFIQAFNDYEMNRGRLQAYGLTDKAIRATGNSHPPLGEYSLVAEVDGAVLSDDFRQGQRVQAGQALMEIACEKMLWIEARLPPNAKIRIPETTPATVKINGEFFTAHVIQQAHTIDPITRTRIVRLSISNIDHKLHPGQFADVLFRFRTDREVLAVPETALTRDSDGDWVVFVEKETGAFVPHKVEPGQHFGQLREIEGIEANLPVAIKGAFFIASEWNKSDFNMHGH